MYEIERKFLVDMDLINLPAGKKMIKQGYIFNEDKGVLRIRTSDIDAFITVKGKNECGKCLEFEYSIPFYDAVQMLKRMADAYIEKDRYLIPHEGHTWEVDIFKGRNEGLVVAEVELNDINEEVILPNWVTEEVTGNPKYYNSNIVKYINEKTES